MKFANIDDAIMEAAKKPAPAKAAKAAPKKAEPKQKKKAPVAAPKKQPAGKKVSAPTTAPKKKSTPAKEPAPAQAKEPETKEEPAKAPEQKPAETKPAPSTDSAEKPKFAPRWLEKKRGIGDRLKSAWKSFTAKPGADLGKAGTSYKSVFHEIKKLMEELQLVEAMLQEQSLNESYDAHTVNNLYAHRNAIRGVLVEQIVREELYKHNVTVAELNTKERVALMETVNVRANRIWEQLAELNMEEAGHTPEELRQRFVDAQRKNFLEKVKYDSEFGNRRTRPKGSLQYPPADDEAADDIDVKDADANWDANMDEQYTLEELIEIMTEAGSHAEEIKRLTKALEAAMNARGPASSRSDVTEKYKALQAARKAAKQQPAMAEQYTLEEWMGMMAEAGYDTAEIDESLRSKLAMLGLVGAAALGGPQTAGAQGIVSPQDSVRQVQAARAGGGESGARDAARFIGAVNAAGRAAGDSVQTGTSRDMGLAQRKAGHELNIRNISQQGARQIIKQNPDGTYSVTIDARKQPTQSGAPNMEEQYTLEEWMGMMAEAGYSLEEGNPDTKKLRQKFDATMTAVHPSNWNKKLPSNPLARAIATHKGRGVYKSKDAPVGLGVDRLTQDFETRHGLPYEHEYEDEDNLSGKIAQAKQNQAARMRDSVYRTAAPLPGTRKGDNAIADRDREPYWYYENLQNMEEQYTLEEWMGMMTEAGYDVSEISQGVRDKVFRTRQAQAERERRKMPGLYQDLKTATEKGDAWRATLPPEQRGRGIYGNQEDAAKSIQTAHNAAIGLGRKASKTFYGGKQGEKLVDKNPSPSSPTDAEIRAAPSLSRATQRTIKNASKMEEGNQESISENTVSRLQELAGIKHLNG